MNLSELNVKEEWAYYNKVAPFQTYLLNGNELKYRYFKKENAKATIVVLAGGSGLADGFFLFLRSLMDKYSLITIPYPLFCINNNETADDSFAWRPTKSFWFIQQGRFRISKRQSLDY